MSPRESLRANGRRYRPYIAVLVAAVLVVFVRPPLADDPAGATGSLSPQLEQEPAPLPPQAVTVADLAPAGPPPFPLLIPGAADPTDGGTFPPPPGPGGGDVPPGDGLTLPDLPSEINPVLALLTPSVGEVCNASGITAGVVSLVAGLRQIVVPDSDIVIPVPQEITDSAEDAIALALIGCGYLPVAPTKSNCGVDDDVLAAGLGVEGLIELDTVGAVIDTIYAAEYLTGAGGNAPLLILGPLLGPYFRCTTEVNE